MGYPTIETWNDIDCGYSELYPLCSFRIPDHDYKDRKGGRGRKGRRGRKGGKRMKKMMRFFRMHDKVHEMDGWNNSDKMAAIKKMMGKNKMGMKMVMKMMEMHEAVH